MFKKYDIIEYNKQQYQCIISDDNIAVFGLFKQLNGHNTTSYTNTFVLNQEFYDSDKYKLVGRSYINKE